MLLVCFAMLHGISPSSPKCEDHVNGIIAKICTLLEEYNLESDDDHGQPSSSFSSLDAQPLSHSSMHVLLKRGQHLLG